VNGKHAWYFRQHRKRAIHHTSDAALMFIIMALLPWTPSFSSWPHVCLCTR
jgi:hypothetical protein